MIHRLSRRFSIIIKILRDRYDGQKWLINGFTVTRALHIDADESRTFADFYISMMIILCEGTPSADEGWLLKWAMSRERHAESRVPAADNEGRLECHAICCGRATLAYTISRLFTEFNDFSMVRFPFVIYTMAWEIDALAPLFTMYLLHFELDVNAKHDIGAPLRWRHDWGMPLIWELYFPKMRNITYDYWRWACELRRARSEGYARDFFYISREAIVS